MTTLEDVEACVWKMLGHYTRAPLVRHVAQIMDAVECYGRDVQGITAERRRVLAGAVPPPVHYKIAAGLSACGVVRAAFDSATLADLSPDPAKTTCTRCQRTRKWKAVA